MLEYASDLFDGNRISRMVGHLLTLLHGMVTDDRRRVSDLPLFGAAQLVELLADFNDTPRSYPQESCVHALFEQQVLRAAEAIALVWEQRQLSYALLDACAERLRQWLAALGLRSDERVAICLERGPGMLIALLAVLKAGAAYVPLDPLYPQDRLDFMMNDSAPRALLSHRSLPGTLPASCLGVLELDYLDLLPTGPLDVVDRGHTARDPRSLAYVIYTSGSTGTPKGVMVEHRSVVNLLTSMAREPGMRPDDTMLAVTTLCFDIAALEIFLPLITGARVVLADRTSTSDPEALQRLLTEHAVTIMQATPATWRLMLDHGWQGRPGLRLLCGGEALPAELASKLTEWADAVWNLFGPTETTIWSIVARIKGTSGRAVESIGRPIANARIYILDGTLQPVPIGVRGEIYIGGHGVPTHPEHAARRCSHGDRAAQAEQSGAFRNASLGHWPRQGPPPRTVQARPATHLPAFVRPRGTDQEPWD